MVEFDTQCVDPGKHEAILSGQDGLSVSHQLGLMSIREIRSE